MKKIRYGMVGGGEGSFIGAVHRNAAQLDGHYELVCGAFSSRPEHSVHSGTALGLDANRCYADFETMFRLEAALPPEQKMQCVVIVTPNHLHFPVARAALQNGFHVISDKPATFNLEECRELADLLGQTGLHYALTHPYTAYPMVQEARQRVMTGQLGNIRKIIVEYIQGWLGEDLENQGNAQAAWRVDPSKAGVSCCMGDIGVHAFNLCEFVSGLEVTSLSAELNTFVDGRQLDDDGTVLMHFANQARGVLLASQVCTGEENNIRLRIYGEKAGLDWQQMEPNTLWLRYPDQSATMLRTGVGELSVPATQATRIPAGHPEGYLEAFANIYVSFARQIRNNLPGLTPGIEAALRGMAFIETVVQSSNSGNQWLEFPGK